MKYLNIVFKIKTYYKKKNILQKEKHITKTLQLQKTLLQKEKQIKTK
jgi:hypothetical protein